MNFNRNNITSSNISVIVQGPVYRPAGESSKFTTKLVISSIRKNFPNAEIILSTWHGSDINDLDYDVVSLSIDPGSYIQNPSSDVYHNVNRQLISTMAGLKIATRKYALKTRSDVIFKNDRSLKYLTMFKKRSADYCITTSRVLVTNITTVNPRRFIQLPFHPCDWFYFGLKEDLINIFDIPLFPEPEFTYWFKTRKYPFNHPNSRSTTRYAPENYIWYSFCKKYYKIEFEHLCDISNNNIKISEKTFANNLVILNPWQLGIVSLKNPFKCYYRYNMYSFKEWVKLYNKYCGGKLPVYFDFEILIYKLCYYTRKVKKYILQKIKFIELFYSS